MNYYSANPIHSKTSCLYIDWINGALKFDIMYILQYNMTKITFKIISG